MSQWISLSSWNTNKTLPTSEFSLKLFPVENSPIICCFSFFSYWCKCHLKEIFQAPYSQSKSDFLMVYSNISYIFFQSNCLRSHSQEIEAGMEICVQEIYWGVFLGTTCIYKEAREVELGKS